MPSAIIHRCVSKKVEEKIKRLKNEKDIYLYDVASVAPDSWRNTTIFKDSPLRKKDKRKYSHFSKDDSFIENYMEFYNKYKSQINHPFIYGYLIHLMTDYFWRIKMYEKSNDIITNSEEKNPISKDVEILTRDISKYYYINKLKELSQEEIEALPIVDELPYDGINTTINFINHQLTNEINDSIKKYNLDMIINGIETVSKLIIEEINKLGII